MIWILDECIKAAQNYANTDDSTGELVRHIDMRVRGAGLGVRFINVLIHCMSKVHGGKTEPPITDDLLYRVFLTEDGQVEYDMPEGTCLDWVWEHLAEEHDEAMARARFIEEVLEVEGVGDMLTRDDDEQRAA